MGKKYSLERGFMIEYAWESSLRVLSPKEFHRAFWALCDYQKSEGKTPVPGIADGKTGIVCSLIVPQINNRLNGAVGGRKTAERITGAGGDTEGTPPPDAEAGGLKIQVQVQEQKQVQEQVQVQECADTAASAHPHRKFTPPTAEEVEAYSREAGFCVDAARFVDYYTSKGWTVGKSPMKDWKAAVRCWERSSAASPSPAPVNPNAPLSGWDYIEAVAKGEIQ